MSTCNQQYCPRFDQVIQILEGLLQWLINDIQLPATRSE
jgi:hypothetical protein